ncbi:sucrase ferredoxin [Nostocoides sp. HKS02]|uniref:sucrase ferredoxin n=1 Tax=Nostocoides sp. HKS02 TaxID=1813880 RepID=UPI0018A80316|nr:sucrase ferredoxin [Tetrasphaera sp. HKS02]
MAVGSSLSEACAARGGRLTLLRRPGRHADEHHPGGHAAYLAWAGVDPWLLEVRLDDPATLLEVDLDALARGDRAAVTASLPGLAPAAPVLLVCTNGRRDVCCAVRGRPVALDAAALVPGRVWEASHTGGHRFAPTGVLLPHGATFARLAAPLCAEILAAAETGTLPAGVSGPRHDRGRSTLEPGAQAAEAHVRHVVDERSLTALTTALLSTDAIGAAGLAGADGDGGDGGDHLHHGEHVDFLVTHRDGRAWRVGCMQSSRGPLSESCGKAPVPVAVWHVLHCELVSV